jgi:hypothetical protein
VETALVDHRSVAPEDLTTNQANPRGCQEFQVAMVVAVAVVAGALPEVIPVLAQGIQAAKP